VISPDVLARYAADAAREVDGVSALADGALHRGGGVEVSQGEGAPEIRVHFELAWGHGAEQVGAEVQRRVAEYLERMADVKAARVDAVVDGVGSPPPSR
jgi:uncharacterized alkaline shock family protein YloU